MPQAVAKEKELSGSARGAHRFSKTPSPWSPPEVFRPDGARALASADILEVAGTTSADPDLAAARFEATGCFPLGLSDSYQVSFFFWFAL